MKVKLKAKKSKLNDLTPENVYRVIGIEADDYRIMNDEGRPYLYSHRLFEVVDAREPKEWQSTKGDDGERYAYPPEMAKPGFFEDFFDGNRAAIATLHFCLQRSRQVAISGKPVGKRAIVLRMPSKAKASKRVDHAIEAA